MAPFFDFFKKKSNKTDISTYPIDDIDGDSKDVEKPNVATYKPGFNRLENGDSSSPTDSKLVSILDASMLLGSQEERKVKELIKDLLPIKSSVEKLLKSAEKTAEDLEKEHIKVEEPRFESIVENSRRTIVFSLRKEATSEIPSITTFEDAIKFESRLESIVNRLSGLSSSHSRVLNAFVKKYASKLQNESTAISTLSRRCQMRLTEYRRFKQSITNAEEMLTSLSQQINTIENCHNAVNNLRTEIKTVQERDDTQQTELHDLESSKEYLRISSIEKELGELETVEQEIRRETIDLFGHVNRAIAKYSYGLSAKKELFMKLQILENEPWKIFYHIDSSGKILSNGKRDASVYHERPDRDREGSAADFSQYLSILNEIQFAITNRRIDLKDSQKVTYYLGQIIDVLPKFNSRLSAIRSRIFFLKEQKERIYLLHKITSLRNDIKLNTMNINENTTKLELLESELIDREASLRNSVSKSQTELSNVLGKPYKIVL